MKPERAPFLRALYAVLFFGVAAGVFGATWPEADHLLFALGRTWHYGQPPDWLALFAALLALAGVGGILWAFVRQKEIPLLYSGLVLGGAVLAYVALGNDEVPQGRSWAAADKAILEVAGKVQRKMVDRLQAEGEVPDQKAAWDRVLAEEAEPFSPARTRTFARAPYQVVLTRDPKARPEGARPGTLFVFVAPDQVAFEITPVGFDTQGEVAPLADEAGEPLVLQGTFNPELRRPAPRGPVLGPLPGLPPTPKDTPKGQVE